MGSGASGSRIPGPATPPRADLAAMAHAVHEDGGQAGDAEADAHDGHAGQDLVPHPAAAAAAAGAAAGAAAPAPTEGALPACPALFPACPAPPHCRAGPSGQRKGQRCREAAPRQETRPCPRRSQPDTELGLGPGR